MSEEGTAPATAKLADKLLELPSSEPVEEFPTLMQTGRGKITLTN